MYQKCFLSKSLKFLKPKYIYKGIYQVLDGNKVHITELPIGIWTDDYKQYLENMIDKKNSFLKDFDDMSTDKEVNITLKLTKGSLLSLLSKNLDYSCGYNYFYTRIGNFIGRIGCPIWNNYY